MGTNPISQSGYDKLKAELEHYETVEMPRIAQLIAEARAEGDLSENAEYHAQRENQGMLQAKINMLKEKLANSYILDATALPKGKVVFGATVTLKNLDDDEVERIQLVGPGEEDYDGAVAKILCDSPLAKQLLHHEVDDRVDVAVPSGTIHYLITAIE